MDIETIKRLHNVLDDITLGNNDLAFTELGKIINEQYLTLTDVVERLPIGTEVTIIDHEDWGEQRNTKKTITGHTDFGKVQGYLLDGNGIYLIEDFVR